MVKATKALYPETGGGPRALWKNQKSFTVCYTVTHSCKSNTRIISNILGRRIELKSGE